MAKKTKVARGAPDPRKAVVPVAETGPQAGAQPRRLTQAEVDSLVFGELNRLSKQIRRRSMGAADPMPMLRALWAGHVRQLSKPERFRYERRLVKLIESIRGDAESLSPVMLPTGDLVYPDSDEELPKVRRISQQAFVAAGTDDPERYLPHWRPLWGTYLLSRSREIAAEMGVRLLKSEPLPPPPAVEPPPADQPAAPVAVHYVSRWEFCFDRDFDVPLLTIDLTAKEHMQSQGGAECCAISRACTHLRRMRGIVDGDVPMVRGSNVPVAVLHKAAMDKGDEHVAAKYGVNMAQIVAAHYFFKLNEERLQSQTELDPDDPAYQAHPPAPVAQTPELTS